MKAARFSFLFVVLAAIFLFSFPAAAQDEVLSVPTAEHDPQFAIDWMQRLYERVEAEGISAPAASRIYAYASITLYEALLPGMPDNNSLSGQLLDMPDMPLPEIDLEYDWPSAANAALYTVLDAIVDPTSDETHKAFADLREQQRQNREKTVAAEVVMRSLAFGEELGQAILEWAATDNYAATRGAEYAPPTGDPSLWVPTRQGMKAVEPYWGEIRPFALQHADQCAVWPNYTFSTEKDSTFYKQALEVKETGDNLTQEQILIARYWVDTPGQTGTPAGHWVLIENQLVEQLGLTLNRAAEMYAMVGVVLGDSFISCWSLKYQINLLRPETYIKEYIRRSWAPLIQSPGFPEYPSGHSVVSTAAAEMLTYLFGTVAFTDRSGKAHGLPERSFTSFTAAANEAAISRLYGGIHYRAAIENGIRQGLCIARTALENIRLNQITQGE